MYFTLSTSDPIARTAFVAFLRALLIPWRALPVLIIAVPHSPTAAPAAKAAPIYFMVFIFIIDFTAFLKNICLRLFCPQTIRKCIKKQLVQKSAIFLTEKLNKSCSIKTTVALKR
jgi:hypothetical protein